MHTMRATMLTHDWQIDLQDHAVPTRRPDQVIVDVDLCGICGSDLHAAELAQVYRPGTVLGHEGAGTISWVGEEVSGWQIGQRVALNPNGYVDGTCPECLADRPNFCYRATMQSALGVQRDGSLAPQVAAYPTMLRALPDSVSRLASAWVEPMATALHATKQAGDLKGRAVLVTGGGPIGQLALRIAKFRGAAWLGLVEPSPDRRAYGTSSGADDTWAPAEFAAKADALHVDVVIEASGNPAATALGLDVLVPGGTFIVVGSGASNVLDATTILLKEIIVRGSFIYTDEFDAAIELLADGSITVDDLGSVEVPLSEVMSAFEILRNGTAMKVLIDPRT